LYTLHNVLTGQTKV